MPDVALGLAGAFSHGRVISELLQAPNSAVGVGFTYVVDGSYWERPVALSFVAHVGETDETDDITLSYLDGSGVPVLTVDTGPTITGPDDVTYSFMAAWTGAAAWSDITVNAALPPVLLQPSWSIVVNLSGTIVGTNLRSIRFYRERFITGDQGYLIGYQTDEGRKEHLLSVLSDLLA